MTLAYSDTRMSAQDHAEWHGFERAYKYGDPECCYSGSHNHLRWRVVHRFYLELGWNAWKVANLLHDDWMFSQSTVYIYAGKIRRVCNISEPDRAGNKKVDWALAEELLNEGMTTDELTEFFKCKSKIIEYSALHAKKPRRKYVGGRYGCQS